VSEGLDPRAARWRRDGAAAPALVVRWEPDLMARAVSDELARHVARGSFVDEQRYRRAADLLYGLPPEQREAEFQALDVRMAREFGLHTGLEDALEQAGWPAGAVAEVVVTPATGRGEGADLRPRAGAGAVVLLALEPARLGTRALAPFLRHELMHISDLLDPEFGYDGDRRLGDGVGTEVRVRERYHALWCASIDARLATAGRADPALAEASASRAVRTLGLEPGDLPAAQSWLAERPTHSRLRACAESPGLLR